ncbi:MAG: alpha/beta hydrolase family protein [Acidimicrobiales bacterium]
MSSPRHGRRVNVRRRQRVVAVLFALLVVLTVLAVKQHFSPSTPTSSATSTPTSSATSTSTTPPPRAPYGVGSITIDINEPAANGLAARSLPTIVRYPTSASPSGTSVAGAPPLRLAKPYPLVVFSQGFDISPEAYARLLTSWASAGYVVADPAYPFTSPNAPGGLVRTDIVHHPADLSYVITSLLGDSAQTSGTLSGLIDANEIGVIGQSDGGDVALAAVANTCCRDPRVKAAIILSGAELSWFQGSYFTTSNAPLLVVQGTNDLTMNPVTCSVQLYNEAAQPKYYLSMIGQTHLSAYVPPGPAQNVVTRVTIDFLNGYLRHSTSALAAMRVAGDVAGLATITSQATLAPVAGTCPDG